MDPEVDPVRLLVVLPHFGNSSSIVQCNLFPVSLSQHHYCFAAIKNTRGNKDIRTNIIINSQIKSITRNLEVCLRRSRHENVAIVLWIREICIDAVDYNCHISPLWRYVTSKFAALRLRFPPLIVRSYQRAFADSIISSDEIFKRACKLLDMSDFMYSLEQKGLLDNEKIIRSDQKTGTSQIEITISRLISQSP